MSVLKLALPMRVVSISFSITSVVQPVAAAAHL